MSCNSKNLNNSTTKIIVIQFLTSFIIYNLLAPQLILIYHKFYRYNIFIHIKFIQKMIKLNQYFMVRNTLSIRNIKFMIADR